MAYNFTDPKIQKNLSDEEFIVSSKFKDTLEEYTPVLSGAYVTYQVSLLDIGITTFPDTPTNPNPVDGLSFSYNIYSKETHRYINGAWELMTEDLLEVIIEAGFTATWKPMSTVIREKSLEVLIPSNSMPINIESSQMIFIGFNNS